MASYIPESALLNNIYIPFSREIIKKVYNCKDHFSIELGSNGLHSVINFSIGSDRIFPFINLRKFDPETKEWFWYDEQGFPYRIYSYSSEEFNWALRSVWDFGTYSNKTISFDPTDLKKETGGRELGFYTVGDADGVAPKMYTGIPIVLTIEGEIVTDRTIYGRSNESRLTELNTTSNKEFYYDTVNNKIHTNQNLNESDSKEIKVHFNTLPSKVSIKCSMGANQGTNVYLTPSVDYYVVKLNGQYLRG